jgi:ubiquinone/menaquinone biosynthesis C-methylase UbiE
MQGATSSSETWLERIARKATRKPLRDPVRWGLAEHRRRALREVTAAYVPRAESLSAGVLRRDSAAVAAFDVLAAEAIARMRASRAGAPRLLSALDRLLYRDGEEILDDPAWPEADRTAVLDRLDRLNEILGSYDAFGQAAEPLLDEARARGAARPHVHDLASGHAGFAIELARRLGERARVSASDLRDEYLALGRGRAASLGVPLETWVQDALDLRGLGAADVDVFTCTQTLHHFAPGMVARMIGEAARAARVGLAFVDAERSWLSIALLAPFVAAWGRSWPLLHDTVVSLRRMYYEEELALLATLAPGLPAGARIETGTAPPGHAWLRVVRAAD